MPELDHNDRQRTHECTRCGHAYSASYMASQSLCRKCAARDEPAPEQPTQEYIIVRDSNTDLRLIVVKASSGEWVTDHVRYPDEEAARAQIARNRAYEGELWRAGKHPAQRRARADS